jgi:hypothetical protein
MSNFFIFKEIEKKFIKIFSIENVFKISRNLKILRKFILKEYESKVLHLINMPKKNIVQSENIENMSKLIFENYKNNEENSIKLIDLLEFKIKEDRSE